MWETRSRRLGEGGAEVCRDELLRCVLAGDPLPASLAECTIPPLLRGTPNSGLRGGLAALSLDTGDVPTEHGRQCVRVAMGSSST